MMDSEEKDLKLAGRYIYCVTEISRRETLNKFGMDGEDVYTIPYRGIGAVVSHCLSKPYQSNNSEFIQEWLIQHEQVVDYFFERHDAVLPLAFDTIVKGGDREVRLWLKDEYFVFKRKIEKISGKQEFGVQVFCDSKALFDEIRTESVEVQETLKEIESKPRGLAYMYTQKLREVMKKELENKVTTYSRDFYEAIRSHVDDVRVDGLKRSENDQEMLLNLSCLIPKTRVSKLARELDRINSTQNFSVKFTGPWPAYSFMT